jgi:hypothetical protein
MAELYPVWKYYPPRQRPPDWVQQVVSAFAEVQDEIDSLLVEGINVTWENAEDFRATFVRARADSSLSHDERVELDERLSALDTMIEHKRALGEFPEL